MFKAEKDDINHNSTRKDGSPCDVSGWDEWHTFYIDHLNGFTTWYLHASDLHPDIRNKIGDDFSKPVMVKQSQIVAFVGNFSECRMVGFHLHFEVRKGLDEIIDPYSEEFWLARPKFCNSMPWLGPLLLDN